MFYDRLKEICKTKNIKITVLLNDLKMSSGNVSSWKKGNVPKAATIEKIADYLGIKTDYLLGRTDDPSPIPRPEDMVVVKGDFVGPLDPDEKELLELVLAAHREKQKKGKE